jgi:restriction system protein
VPIPDFQTIMLPLLQMFRDGEAKTTTQMYAELGDHFGLSEQERAERLPSGNQTRFQNRVGWARTHLKKAGLLERIGSGLYKIAPRGRDVLANAPPKIDVHFLDQFEEHLEFRKARKPKIESLEADAEHTDQTPKEILEKAYQTLRDSLGEEILEKVRQAPPIFFEQLVVELLLKMGYGGSRQDAGSAIGRSGDGGIDGIIKEDKLGLDVIYIQAKRWAATVGRPEIQAFVGSLEGHRANKGVFITTSHFSGDAKDYVTRIGKKIVLIDGEQLSEMMIDHDVGVTTEDSYVVKRIDSDYFIEE